MLSASPTHSPTAASRLTQYLAIAAHSRGFATAITALAVAFTATLASVTLLPASTGTSVVTSNAMSVLLTTLGAALSLALAVWLVGSRIALDKMQTRARAWERSIESMNVGIALYDRDDRLMNCNAAFRSLYPEIAALLVPGADFYEAVSEYYKRAPAEVVDGRSLERSWKKRGAGAVAPRLLKSLATTAVAGC